MHTYLGQITKSLSETFLFPSTDLKTKAVLNRPSVETMQQCLADWLVLVGEQAMLDTIEGSQKALEKLAKDSFPTSEKEIRGVVGRKYYIRLLKNDFARIELKREEPLEITFEKGEELILAHNDTFNLSGIGSTREEALQDLIDFFIHDYFSYKNTPSEKLSKEAELLLHQYEAVIETYTKL